jgi:hypothetical protein
MKKLLLLALLLFPTWAFAQPFNAQIEAARGYHKSYTTALLPIPCRPGTEAFDTTAQVTKVCLSDTVTWATAGGGGTATDIKAGTTTVTGCTITDVLYKAVDGTLGCENTFEFNPTADALKVENGFNMGANKPKFTFNTILTPDAGVFETGTISNSLHFGANGEFTDDTHNGPCGTGVCTDPTFIVHSAAGNTTDQWLAFWHDGADANIGVGLGSLKIPSTTIGGTSSIVNNTPFYFGSSSLGGLVGATGLTPDNPALLTGSTGMAWHLYARDEWFAGFDYQNGACGTSACVDSSLTAHIHTEDTTQYATFNYLGTAGGAKKTLTDATLTTVFRVPVASDTAAGGLVDFQVYATNGTAHQQVIGTLQFGAVAEGTTETCGTPTVQGTPYTNVTTGTLTCTFACDTATPTNGADIQFNCDTSLNVSPTLYWSVKFLTSAQVQVIPQ